MSTTTHPITRWLERSGPFEFTLFAASTAFVTYFCMYAFRKPFSGASFEGELIDGSGIGLKTAFVIAQLIGYTLSKYLGVKFISEMSHRSRAAVLIGLIGIAELSLLGFGALPTWGRVVAIFINGLPLGAVWGVVVTYLEGRRTSETLLAGLSCSYIVASGAVKDVGRWIMSDWGVSAYWMPVTTGLLFLPLFIVSVWLLDKLPDPSPADQVERSERTPMTAKQRGEFVMRFLPGLVLLLLTYLMLTAVRDFRDNFGAEMIAELGLADVAAIFTKTELPVSFGVMGVLALLSAVRSNRAGLMLAMGIMTAGVVLVGVCTALLEREAISPVTWMILVGLGTYLAYVPFGSVLFDRLMAFTRAPGTAVFAIYIMDAAGYTGSVAMQLTKDVLFGDISRLRFFIQCCYAQAWLGLVCLVGAAVFFLVRVKAHPTERVSL